MAREARCQRDAGQVVIAQRWMTGVGEEQYFVLYFTRYKTFAVAEAARLQRGIDTDFVIAVAQRESTRLFTSERDRAMSNS